MALPLLASRFIVIKSHIECIASYLFEKRRKCVCKVLTYGIWYLFYHAISHPIYGYLWQYHQNQRLRLLMIFARERKTSSALIRKIDCGVSNEIRFISKAVHSVNADGFPSLHQPDNTTINDCNCIEVFCCCQLPIGFICAFSILDSLFFVCVDSTFVVFQRLFLA